MFTAQWYNVRYMQLVFLTDVFVLSSRPSVVVQWAFWAAARQSLAWHADMSPHAFGLIAYQSLEAAKFTTTLEPQGCVRFEG